MERVHNAARLHARMKQNDLASGVGAGLLGAGVGVLAAAYLSPYAVPLVVVGAILHLWAMWERHRLEAGGARVWWAEALYWLCWALLLVIGGLVLLG